MLATFEQISNQDITTTSTYKAGKTLGTIGVTRDGRFYRFAQAGAVDLLAGKLNITPAKTANHTEQAVAAASAAGATSVSVTLGATAATLDQYADGYLTVVTAAGLGQNLLVQGHQAISSAGTGTINLKDPVLTALTTASKYSLVNNPWSNTIISSAAAALFTAGVPQTAVVAASYYWAQTQGLSSVLSDGIVTKAAGAIVSASVNGAVTIELAATVTQRVGVAPEATVDAKYYPLYLTLE